MWRITLHWITMNYLKIGNDEEEHHFQTEKFIAYRKMARWIKASIKEKEAEGIETVSFTITRIKE